MENKDVVDDELQDICLEIRNEVMDRAMVKYDCSSPKNKPYIAIYKEEMAEILTEPYYKAVQTAYEKEKLEAREHRTILTPLHYKTRVNARLNKFTKWGENLLTYILNKLNVKF